MLHTAARAQEASRVLGPCEPTCVCVCSYCVLAQAQFSVRAQCPFMGRARRLCSGASTAQISQVVPSTPAVLAFLEAGSKLRMEEMV